MKQIFENVWNFILKWEYGYIFVMGSVMFGILFIDWIVAYIIGWDPLDSFMNRVHKDMMKPTNFFDLFMGLLAAFIIYTLFLVRRMGRFRRDLKRGGDVPIPFSKNVISLTEYRLRKRANRQEES
jgi:hypothetical protein